MPDWRTLVQQLNDFRDAPRETSDYLAIVLALLVVWFLVRRRGAGGSDLKGNALDVLEKKYKSGELSKEAYDKAREDLTLRPKGR